MSSRHSCHADRVTIRPARLGALALGAVLLVGAVAAAGYPVYVEPEVDEPRKADAILVVGGDAPEPRYQRGAELARQGLAAHLVLSNPGGQVQRHCAETIPGVTVECFDPEPRSTLGEARALGRIAAERNWRTVIVVTYTPHISRARHIMSSCFDGALVMVEVPVRLSVRYWAWMYLYQSAGYVKAWLGPGCE